MKNNQERKSEGKKNGAAESSSRRKTFYQDYYEDYEERQVLSPDGRGFELKRIYIGAYYEQKLTILQRIMLRVLYLSLFAVAVSLFLKGATSAGGSNQVWYVVVPEAASIPFVFLTGWTFLHYFPAVGKMKSWDYRNASLKLKKYSRLAGTFVLVTAAVTVLFILLHLNTAQRMDWLGVLALVGCGAVLLLIYFLESRIVYIKTDNDEADTSKPDCFE